MYKLLIPLILCSSVFAEEFLWQQGDIIAQSGEGGRGQIQMIKNATNSEWTHIGVVMVNDGETMVFEAVQPVRLKPVKEFIERTKKFKILRLKEPVAYTPEVLEKGRKFLLKNKGKNYDFKFMWGDDKMYCSELVWKCYKNVLGVELSTPKTFEEFILDDPLVAKTIKERFGGIKNLPFKSP